VSFDICSWPYSRLAHVYLAQQFNNDDGEKGKKERTRLVCGDSAQSMKSFAKEVAAGAEEPFDAIFIDGGVCV
jgi:hypothetical protein